LVASSSEFEPYREKVAEEHEVIAGSAYVENHIANPLMRVPAQEDAEKFILAACA
jgi:hypothetical protein